MKKVLYLYGGGEAFHPSEWAGGQLSAMLAADGRFTVEATRDFDALAALPNGEYAVVVLNTTGFNDELSGKRAQGLFDFVRNGGGFVGLHSAADSFHNNRTFIEMLGGEFVWHPHHHEFKVTVTDHDHFLTTRMPDFSIYDEMYHLKNFDANAVTLLATTMWQGQAMPMAYTKAYGKGRVSYIALGHTEQAWKHPEFQKLLIRAIAFGAGADLPDKTIRCGLLGYGPAFNMGKGHAGWIDATPGMHTIAMCDTSPARVEAAKTELPDLRGYFTSLDEMLAMNDLDLVVNILPHNLHAPATLQCLAAGKHVVLEKPFCITVAEANAMIDLARAKGLMLSLFHNRRWDGDYLTIKDLINRGLIGDVYHVECGQMGYNHPGFWWRSDKTVSGGIMYDWGAHFLDWILNLMPNAKLTQVMGNFQKRVWHAVTNEDFGQVYLRFDNGATADYITSQISASSRPKWRIQGTQGAIEQNWGDMTLTSFVNGIRQDSTVKVTLPGYGSVEYYRNVADHLLLGEELSVKPEQARRVIGVIEAAQLSSEQGRSVPPCAGCE